MRKYLIVLSLLLLSGCSFICTCGENAVTNYDKQTTTDTKADVPISAIPGK